MCGELLDKENLFEQIVRAHASANIKSMYNNFISHIKSGT
jgi:hypothetical protein